MLRTVVWFSYFWIYLFLNIPNLLKAQKMKKDGKNIKEFVYTIAEKWADKFLRLAGMEVVVEGLENIPENEPILFVANHQSNFDIPILVGNLGFLPSFIGKIELKKMPFVGAWMELIDCIFIDRNDIRQSIKAINTGAKIIKNGQAMIIFPEGTRSKDGSLSEFKAGSFKLATKSNAKVIPITIDGSIDVMQKKSLIIRAAKVYVTVSKPLELADDERDTALIAKLVEEEINSVLKR